jgi:RNA polymerase sigma factor (TIGR02999 family)
MSRMADVTRILSQIDEGDPAAAEQLLPLVYDELRKLAASRLARERPDHTLQATALVHEAYVRLVHDDKSQNWNSRGHFFAAAAEAMRRILVEQARRKAGPASGGSRQRLGLSAADAPQLGSPFDVLALNEALDRLAADYPRAAEVVKLRFFAGLTRQEAADALGVSLTTVDDDWAYAKGRLRVDLV